MTAPLHSDSPTGLGCARYSRRPFPSYRFVPGQNPHPTADPRGHSYQPPGHPGEPPFPVDPQAWDRCEPYLYAVDLYNHGYWWEAHESWESVWQLTDKAGVQGRFLQGLIQSGACHLKIHLGKPEGVERLRRTSVGHLRWVLERLRVGAFMGIQLAELAVALETYFDLCVGDGTAIQHHLQDYPFIRLISS